MERGITTLHTHIHTYTLTHITTLHYGAKPGHFEILKIHFPMSEGVSEVSEVSERANE